MCVLHLFDTDTGEELSDISQAQGRPFVAVGRLLFPERQKREGETSKNEDGVSLEVAFVVGGDVNDLEILSDKEVRGTFDEVRTALQDLGFTLLEWVYQRMFENIRLSLGLPEEEKTA